MSAFMEIRITGGDDNSGRQAGGTPATPPAGAPAGGVGQYRSLPIPRYDPITRRSYLEPRPATGSGGASPPSPGKGSNGPASAGRSRRNPLDRGRAYPVSDRRAALFRQQQIKMSERAKAAAEKRAEQAKRNAERKAEQDQVTLARVKRMADKKLEAQRRQKERQATQAKAATQQRNAQYAQIAVTASKGGPSALANAGSAAGAIVGGALGGPAGAIVGEMVGKEIGEKIHNPFKKYTDALDFGTKAIGVAGRAFQQVAGNDGVGAISGVAKEVASGLEDIPVVGTLAASSIKFMTAGFDAVTGTVAAFNERGRQLSGYSGALAVSTAKQDVTRILGDIRESQELGQKLSALMDKQTEFEEFMRELLMPVKELAISKLPSLMNFIMDALTEMIKIGYLIPGVADDKVRKAVEDLAKIREKLTAGDATDLLDPLGRLAAAGLVFAPPPGAPVGALPRGGMMPVPLGVPAILGAPIGGP